MTSYEVSRCTSILKLLSERSDASTVLVLCGYYSGFLCIATTHLRVMIMLDEKRMST